MMHKNNHVVALENSFQLGLVLLTLLAAASSLAQVGPPPADDVTTEEASNAETLRRAAEIYDQAIEGELYNEAADATKLYIGALLRDPEHDPLEWGRALERLGNAQRRTGEVDASIENYLLSIDVIQRESDRLNEELITPLHGLGRSLSDIGEFRAAVDVYIRMQHVQQVNHGLYTLDQAEAINELSEIHLRMGENDRANALQQAYVSIYAQNYPGKDLRQLPALYSQADMYYKTDRLIDSQTSYRRIISLIERSDTSQSLHLLPAIYRISDLLQNNIIVDGDDGAYKARRFLRRAVYIAEHHEDASNLDRADAHIAMGDHYSLHTADRRLAMRSYVSAIQQLSADDNLQEALEARFGKPTHINYQPANTTTAMRQLTMMSQTGGADLQGKLLVRYDVAADGRAYNVRMVESDPTGYWDSIIVDHVDRFIFRPAFVEGEAVEIRDLTYEIQYSLLDQDLRNELRQNGLSKRASYQTQ
jgi:hypothetical protein